MRSASRLRHPRVGIAAWSSRRRKYQPKCSCVWGVGALASWRGVGQLQHSSPNQTLHLTGAALLVSRDTRSHRRPRQVSWVVRHRGFDIAARHPRVVIAAWASRRRKYQPKCSCVGVVGALASWRGLGRLPWDMAEPGAAPDRGGMTAFQGSQLPQPPRQVSFIVRHRGFGIRGWASRRGQHGVENINRNVLACGASEQ